VAKLWKRPGRKQRPTDAEIAVLAILRNRVAATPLAVIATELRSQGRGDVDAQLAVGRLVGMKYAVWGDAQDGVGAWHEPSDSMITDEGREFLVRHERTATNN